MLITVTLFVSAPVHASERRPVGSARQATNAATILEQRPWKRHALRSAVAEHPPQKVEQVLRVWVTAQRARAPYDDYVRRDVERGAQGQQRRDPTKVDANRQRAPLQQRLVGLRYLYLTPDGWAGRRMDRKWQRALKSSKRLGFKHHQYDALRSIAFDIASSPSPERATREVLRELKQPGF